MNNVISMHNEQLLRLVAEDFSKVKSKEMNRQIKNSALNSDFAITDDDRTMFNRLIKREKLHTSAVKLHRYSARKTAVLIAAVTLIIASAFSVGAFREAVSNFFTEFSNGFVSIKAVTEFNGNYAPVNPPDGYTYERIDNSSNPRSISYTDGKHYLYFNEYSEGRTPLISDGREVSINGNDGILSDNTLVWQINGCYYSITSTDSSFDLVNFASTVKSNYE